MDDAPMFRVTRGDPTPEELAALIGVVLRRPTPVDRAAAPHRSLWSRGARPGFTTDSGLPYRTGRTAWRESSLPR